MQTRNRGFTLIELLVVVAIIGTLASVVLASLNTARTKSEDTRRLADVRTLETAIAAYESEFSELPGPNGWTCSGDAGWSSDAAGTLSGDLNEWLAELPLDPTGNTAVNVGGQRSWDAGFNGYCVYVQNGSGSIYNGMYGVMITLAEPNPELEAEDQLIRCDGTTWDPGTNGDNTHIMFGFDCSEARMQ